MGRGGHRLGKRGTFIDGIGIWEARESRGQVGGGCSIDTFGFLPTQSTDRST